MELCTKLSDRVLTLETTKTAQAKEIANLKKRVIMLERKRTARTPRMNLFKIGISRRRSLGEEDASKKGRNLKQGKEIFKESDFDDEGFNADMDHAIKDVEGDAELVISAAVDEVSTVKWLLLRNQVLLQQQQQLFEDEDLTIAQTLVKMRSEKSKVRGVVMKEPSETATRPTIPPQQNDPKNKGKGKMVKQEKPLKKKDQIKFDEEIAQRLQVQLQAELEDEERLAKQREEDANIAKLDDVQAMIDANYELAARLQAEEQGELTIEEKSRLLVELMDKRKKHFARLRAEEQRRKPLTKAQKRNQMCTYLKNMAGFTHNQLKNKIFNEVQKAFDKTMNDDDDDKEKEDLKQCFEIVPEEVPINAISLATKPAPIVEFDTEDMENLWKLVKAKHGYKMLEEAYERVLWGDLKVIFEPHVEDAVWMNLQGQKILIWKLYDSCGVHFVRFQNMHIYMLVEKTYYLIPATITKTLNKKLQAEYWNEMPYQLLKLMTKLAKKK
ncbi:hypothetical protein Tco_0294205 [Tanacetum coccineum]